MIDGTHIAKTHRAKINEPRMNAFMNYTIQEKCEIIKKKCLEIKSVNVYDIFIVLTSLDCVSIHGPEHHFIDGACLLTAYKNAGGKINLEQSLVELMQQGLKMPGAMCGKWGVCGAVTSVGAALAIMDKTEPLSTEDWGEHMTLTSGIVAEMAKIGGPRCCKRDGLLALEKTAEYINKHHNITIEWTLPICGFSKRNEQCLTVRCPYYTANK